MLTLSSCQKGCPGIVIKILPSQVANIDNDYHLFGRRYLLYAPSFKKSILRVPTGESRIIAKKGIILAKYYKIYQSNYDYNC